MLLLEAWVLSILCFLLVSASLWGFGLLALRKLGSGLLYFFFGFSVFLTAFYSVGILGFYSKSGLLLVLLIGWIWFFKEIKTTASLVRELRKKIKFGVGSLWLLFPVLYFAARFLSAGLPQQHSDPLYYHLLGPKLWAQWGIIKVVEQHPSLVQATLWESLYGIPQVFLFFLKPLSKNIVTQLYAQWLHLFWGHIASVVVLYALMKKILATLGQKLSVAKAQPGTICREQIVFFAWLLGSLPALEWTSALAKNDYMVFLFTLLAFFSVLEKRFLLAGFFAGLLFSVKIMGFWTVGALFILIPYRAWGQYICGGLVGVLPNLARSLFYTKNPVFPALDNVIGPGWISDGWNGANGTFVGAPALHGMHLWFWNQFLNMGLSKVALFVGLAGYAAYCIQKKKFVFSRELTCLLLQAAIAILILKPLANGRYATPILALTLVYLWSVTLVFLARKHWVFYRAQFVFLALGFLLTIPVESFVKIPRDFLFEPADLYLKKFHSLYFMQEQLNALVPAGEPVFTATEKVSYYIDHDFECTTEMRRWEKVFKQATQAKDIVSVVERAGYRYFMYYPNGSKLFAGWVLPPGFEQYDRKALIKNNDYVLLDLKK